MRGTGCPPSPLPAVLSNSQAGLSLSLPLAKEAKCQFQSSSTASGLFYMFRDHLEFTNKMVLEVTHSLRLERHTWTYTEGLKNIENKQGYMFDSKSASLRQSYIARFKSILCLH